MPRIAPLSNGTIPTIHLYQRAMMREMHACRSTSQKHLEMELLVKLLKGELATRRRKNLVQARSFSAFISAASLDEQRQRMRLLFSCNDSRRSG